MASENTKKGTAKASATGTKKKTAVTKKSTATTKNTTKKGSTVKKTTTTKKSGVKTTTVKKEPVKKVAASKSTTKVKASPKQKTTTKKQAPTTPAKKVVRKEDVKPIKEEKIETVVKEEKVVEKREVKVDKKEHEHFSIYAFLLSTVIICLYVMSRFTFHIDSVTIGYSVVLFSTVYFISDVITKKFDFKKSILAILISTLVFLLFIAISRYLNTSVLDSYVVYGQVFAYFISQLLNLIIYYYLLVNTELKARWIYLDYLFALAAYYFISVLFSTRIIMTEIFWPTVFCSIILSGILAVMYAFYDTFIERGHE